MSLSERYRGDRPAPASTSSFSCPLYEPKPGSKRCRHYLDGGACARPDEFMCVEWLKANGHTVPPPTPDSDKQSKGTAQASPAPESRPTDLFGNAVPVRPAPAPAVRSPASPPGVERLPSAPESEERPAPRGLTTEDIDSFKALGAEVCMRSAAFGEVWLVPEYTGDGRKEITPEHAATICRVLDAFPGSQVVSFEKNPKPDKEAHE